jgi:hypothetical protein
MNGSNFRAVRQVPKRKETPPRVYASVRKGALIASTFRMSTLSVGFGSLSLSHWPQGNYSSVIKQPLIARNTWAASHWHSDHTVSLLPTSSAEHLLTLGPTTGPDVYASVKMDAQIRHEISELWRESKLPLVLCRERLRRRHCYIFQNDVLI